MHERERIKKIWEYEEEERAWTEELQEMQGVTKRGRTTIIQKDVLRFQIPAEKAKKNIDLTLL